MADIKLTADGNDLDVSSGGLELVTDPLDVVSQRLKIGLRFVKGEYRLDTSRGIPYFEDVFKKDPDLLVVRTLLRDKIQDTDGVVNITSFDLALDSATRKLSVGFSCQVEDAETLLSDEVAL